MPNIYGELKRAQLERLASDPSAALNARIIWNTTINLPKVDDGSLVRAILVNGAKCIVGNAGATEDTVNNVRLHRSANYTLQLLQADDTTAEGSASAVANWAKLQSKLTECTVDTVLDFVEQGSKPSAPAASSRRLYWKDDGRFYSQDSAGTEVEIGASGGGGINYCKNPDAETGTAGWVEYKDAAQAAPENGFTDGAAASVELTQETANDLRGAEHFKLTIPINSVGEGVAYAFVIDEADQGRMINISFDYKVDSDYAANDIHVWIYDVDSSELVAVTPYQIAGTSDLTNHKFSGTFQAKYDGASPITNYRLILHCAANNAAETEFDFDNVKISPQVVSYGPAMTDWIAYTPVTTWVAGIDASWPVAYWRRVGTDMEGFVEIKCDGAPTATVLTVTLPPGYSIDTDKAPLAQPCGQVLCYDDNATKYYPGFIVVTSSTQVDCETYFDQTDGTNYVQQAAVSSTQPFVFADDDFVRVWFKVPILGWSSNLQMSSDVETRVIAAEYISAGGNQADTGNLDDIDGLTLVKDTHSKMNTTTGIYTCPVAGWYEGTVFLNWAGTHASSSYVAVLHGSTRKAETALVDTTNSVNGGNGTACFYCDAGDTIKFQAWQNSGGNRAYSTSTRLMIHRVSGPSQIAASEFIGAKYTMANNDSMVNATPTRVCYDTKVYDTHGAVSFTNFAGDDWVFTCPVAGYYRIKAAASVVTSATWDAGESVHLSLYIDDVAKEVIGIDMKEDSITRAWASGSTTYYCTAGQTIHVEVVQNSGGNLDTDADALYNYICIEKVG